MAQLSQAMLDFFSDLSENNNRDWFNENKSRYQVSRKDFKTFLEAVAEAMGEHDTIERAKVFRINRDLRFTKDKTPYKSWLGGYLERATALRRGGYYLHIEPGNCFLGGGFWAPERDDLARIRQEIAADDQPLREILADETFRQHFGALQGDQLKTAPKGYPRDHKAVDLLRFKQFLVVKHFSDEEVLQAGFKQRVVDAYKAMLPFFDYMSEVLTTDANGVPLEGLE